MLKVQQVLVQSYFTSPNPGPLTVLSKGNKAKWLSNESQEIDSSAYQIWEMMAMQVWAKLVELAEMWEGEWTLWPTIKQQQGWVRWRWGVKGRERGTDLYHVPTVTPKLLCPAKDSSLLVLGLLYLHPKSYLSLPEALMEAPFEAMTCESLLLPDSTTVTRWASGFRLAPSNNFLNQLYFAVLFGCVCLMLLNYPAVFLMPSSSALSSSCILPPPGFAFC